MITADIRFPSQGKVPRLSGREDFLQMLRPPLDSLLTSPCHIRGNRYGLRYWHSPFIQLHQRHGVTSALRSFVSSEHTACGCGPSNGSSPRKSKAGRRCWPSRLCRSDVPTVSDLGGPHRTLVVGFYGFAFCVASVTLNEPSFNYAQFFTKGIVIGLL